jgi:hypothetical protein
VHPITDLRKQIAGEQNGKTTLPTQHADHGVSYTVATGTIG